MADPALMERVIANLVGNALRYSPAASPPLVTARARWDRSGVGLGLTVSCGLAEAMGGTVEPEETPGGGLTMVVSLPAASATSAAETGGVRRIRAA
jgi:two-component system sensor histidine kinase KdpD